MNQNQILIIKDCIKELARTLGPVTSDQADREVGRVIAKLAELL